MSVHRSNDRVQAPNRSHLLDRYVLDCTDKGQPIQQGRVEPWRTAIGHVRAVEVTRQSPMRSPAVACGGVVLLPPGREAENQGGATSLRQGGCW